MGENKLPGIFAGIEAQMRRELLEPADDTIVTDEEAHLVRDIVRRQEMMEDPYAWHRGIEEFLRARAKRGEGEVR